MTRFTFTFVFLFSSLALAKSLPLNNTKWVNEDKSHMILQEDEKGRLTGIYSTFVGCDAEKPLPIIGQHRGRIVTFEVNFPDCNSTAAWNGIVSDDGKTIKAMWLLVIDKGDPQQWDETLTSQDIFIKQ